MRKYGSEAASSLKSWWRKLTGGYDFTETIDYYAEGLELQEEGHHHEALTSFRLALKESPGDPIVLQQIAVSYTRIGMPDEAAKTYRHVLIKDPDQPGANYGLAFILLRAGQQDHAIPHLEAFLHSASGHSGSDAHLAHARATLSELRLASGRKESASQSA